MNRGGLTGKFKPYIFLKTKFLVAGFTVVYVMLKTRAVSDLNSFKNVPLVFYFNRILNNALKKEKAVKITKATLVKYYANRLNNPSTQPQGREGGEGGYSTKFYTREDPPRGPTLYQLLYTIFDRKGTPYREMICLSDT